MAASSTLYKENVQGDFISDVLPWKSYHGHIPILNLLPHPSNHHWPLNPQQQSEAWSYLCFHSEFPEEPGGSKSSKLWTFNIKSGPIKGCVPGYQLWVADCLLVVLILSSPLLAGPHPHMFKLWAAALILIVLVRADGHIYLSTIYISTLAQAGRSYDYMQSIIA